MAPYTRCLRPEDYTVGWIAALPLELQAAVKQLDEEDCPLPQGAGDPLNYVLGRIGCYNVAMACLPAGQTGLSSAAMVATRMKDRFPYLRFGLLVGIGGGVPSKNQEIRLGDIVVSQPNDRDGGVIQYDFGKNTTSGFRRTGSLNTPPEILLSALATYQARNLDNDGSSISHRFKPQAPNQDLGNHPGPDLLFDASYEHIQGVTCERCDKEYLTESKRNNPYPMVHYGTIASGNQVIKNGKIRDQLSMELEGVLCFEMEAAGIMNTFPALVIRGICDYSDSHKAKIWQRYAALAAAIYAKDFLSGIAPFKAPETPQSSSALIKYAGRLSKSKPRPHSTTSSSQDPHHEIIEQHSFLAYNISNYDYLQTHWEFAHRRCPGTTQWILKDRRYMEWREGDDPCCLWLTGSIGSGKSLIVSTIIESLLETHKDNLVLQFFFRHSYTDELSATMLINSCIKQMFDRLGEGIFEHHDGMLHLFQQMYGRKSRLRSFEEILERVFKPLIDSIDEQVDLIIDGLDECDDKEISKVLKLARYMLQKSSRKVLISGRESLSVEISRHKCIPIHISTEEVADDILNFIQWSIEEKMQEKKITSDPQILTHIRTALFEKADRMILWVKMQIESIWEDCYTDAEILSALSRLPKDLNETYGRCIDKIDTLQGLYSRDFAAKIFPWVLSAVKPFTLIQLQQAFAINTTTGVFDKLRVPTAQDILRSCANLIIQDSAQRIFFAHHSVRQYIERSDSTRPFFRRSSAVNRELPLVRVILLHLTSSDYSLAVQKIGETALHLKEDDIERLTVSIPWWARRWMPQPKAIQLRLPLVQSEVDSAMQPPEFFFLAREQWADLTRGMQNKDTSYEQFCDLVLSPNNPWRMHPWKSVGLSLESHNYGMLGWSIANKHKAMFDLLFANGQPSLRQETLQIPFEPYGNISPLLLAVRNDATWAIDTIQRHYPSLDLKASFSTLNDDGWNALHHAADTDSCSMIAKLYTDIKVPIEGNFLGPNPLEVAASRGHALATMQLLEIPEARTTRALACVIRNSLLHGNLDLLEKSTSYFPDPDRLKFDETDVLAAWEAGHFNTVRFAFPRIVQISYRAQRKIFLDAVEANELGFVDVFSKHYSFLNRLVMEEALLSAGKRNSIDMIDLLMSSRHINREDIPACIGSSTFHEAVKAGYIQLVESLLKSGMNPDYPSPGYIESPLSIAIRERNKIMIKLLLHHGADPNRWYGQMAIPLDLTLDIAAWEITELLLEYGANPCLAAPYRPCSLHRAAGSASIPSAALKLLLKYAGQEWNILYKGQTPLMAAAVQGDADKVQLLISMPAAYPVNDSQYLKYIDTIGYDGLSALQLSRVHGHKECARIIMQARTSVINGGKIPLRA